MAPVRIVFYAEGGDAPVVTWLLNLPDRAFAKGRIRLELLAQKGHELRRPHADLLRDDVYELRWRLGTVNYRLLYAFHGRAVVVLLHGLTKEKDVPPGEIDVAIKRPALYRGAPREHEYEGKI